MGGRGREGTCRAWHSAGRVPAGIGRAPPDPSCHATPTVGIFVALQAVLRGDGGIGLTVRGGFTTVELSHRWRPRQVFNDLDFNWIQGGVREG